MSGRGLVSCRLPESMLERLGTVATGRAMSTNELARTVVDGLPGLSGSQIRSIPEPRLEATNPRLSLYLGQEGLQVLNAAATSSGLSPSSVLRRALNAAVTRNLITPVQRPTNRKDELPLWLSILFVIAIAIVLPILTGLVSRGIASEQQKGRS